MPSKELKEIYRIEKEENVMALGIMQNRKPFHIPLSLALMNLSFQNFNRAAPALMKMVTIKNPKAIVNSPEML